MKQATKVILGGRHPELNDGAVNPPVVRTSTVLSPTVADWETRSAPGFKGLIYGRLGTSTTACLEEAIADLEGGFRSLAYPSGLAANVGAILPFVQAGDHVVFPDTVYGPVRRFASNTLARMMVASSYYDPTSLQSLQAAIRPETKVVYVEAPGSLTFEMQDVPAIAKTARTIGAVTVMDNTWATPLYFRPFDHGVDVSVQAGTKYISGHSDVMIGIVTANERCFDRVCATRLDLGLICSPDDAYLAQRGLRTLHVRLKQHWAAGLRLADWLRVQPEVQRIMHPALPGDPGHSLWARDFTGACGLFAFVLSDVSHVSVSAFIDAMPLFNVGASWGGFESLIMPIHLEKIRTATPWPYQGPALRLHAGLEDVDDLLDDLETGMIAMRAEMRASSSFAGLNYRSGLSYSGQVRNSLASKA